MPILPGAGSIDGIRGESHTASSIAATVAIAPPAPAPAAAAGTALLWVLIERFGAGRFFAALYSRLAPSQLLENERREQVLTLVRERPGIGPQDVASALGTGWGVTIYHLTKLERAGFLSSQRTGHHRCYFIGGAVGREQQKTASMFRVLSTRRIAELVARKPGLTQSQLAGELGLSASAMSKQVARLEEAALLRREATAGTQRLYPQPTLAGALA
jgi:predicted transcriptional regulator